MAARWRLSLSLLFGSLLPLLPQAVLASKGGSDYYEALGLSCDAKLADVRKAYRREALEWHPDKKPERRREEAEERFRRIAEAYAVLSNSYARSRYDRQRRSPFCGFFGSDFGDTGGQSNGKDFNFEDFSFTFESAEYIFRLFFGDEDLFAEAKEQIRRAQDVMMDAMRKGEAIMTQMSDLWNNEIKNQVFGDEGPVAEAKEQIKKGREAMTDAMREAEAIMSQLGDVWDNFEIKNRFFGDEGPFAEAKEQIKKGKEAMIDAIRKGETITSRLGDLWNNFEIKKELFGDESPFAEAKEQIKKGQEAMMDAMRKGEAITSRLGDVWNSFEIKKGQEVLMDAMREGTSRLGDLLKNFVGEPGDSGDAQARTDERSQEKAPHARQQDEQAWADGREHLREERMSEL